MQQKLSNFQPASNDIVIFYYSGHGFHKANDNSAWPSLDMRQSIADNIEFNSLSLDRDIYRPLCAKGARLTLVIGECCNMYAGAIYPVKQDPRMMAPSNMLNAESIKTLFNKTGKLLVATSNNGEPSYYSPNNGGDFCNNFISSLIQETGISNLKENIKWLNLYNSARQSTTNASSLETITQHPVSHYEIIE